MIDMEFAIYQWGVEIDFSGKAYFKKAWVRNLPMRSWNRCEKMRLVSKNAVRNLPMRSWNSSLSTSQHQTIQRSQFTNEELKLKSFDYGKRKMGKFAIYQWGVEIWVEALSEYLYDISSQFTNEELKLLRLVLCFVMLYMFAIYRWGVEIENN